MPYKWLIIDKYREQQLYTTVLINFLALKY